MSDPTFHELLSDLPRAIWFPAPPNELPRCFQGSPEEMIREMIVGATRKNLGTHESIDLLLRDLSQKRRVHISIPDASHPESERAAIFVAALIVAQVARPMPTPPS